MKRLIELRKKINKSQADIALFLGVARPTYTNYETGKREPDILTLLKLAKYYNVTVDYLIDSSDIIMESKAPSPLQTAYDKADEGTKAAVRKLLDLD